MKIFLWVLFSLIQYCCAAQNYKVKKQHNNYYEKHKKIDAQFVSINDSIILYYHSYSSHFKTQEFEAYDKERALEIATSVMAIRLNSKQFIPDSSISIKGTYFIYANWYDGFIPYDSFQGFLKFHKIKKDRIKAHVYLIGITGQTSSILIDKKKVLFLTK